MFVGLLIVLVDLPQFHIGGDVLIRSKRILMLGVDETTSESLIQAISPLSHSVQSIRERSIDKCLAAIEKVRPHIVCVPPDSSFYSQLRRALSSRGLNLPFVVVSGAASPSEWRAALEGGAAEYFSAPFERTKVSEILASALTNPMSAFLAFEPT